MLSVCFCTFGFMAPIAILRLVARENSSVWMGEIYQYRACANKTAAIRSGLREGTLIAASESA
jgi:hypothetical protein